MQYLVIFENGRSECFYNENVANMYKTINGGFVVNLLSEQMVDNSEDLEYTVSVD